jgi:hypothetical protein
MFYKSYSNGIYLISILVFVKCEFVWSPFNPQKTEFVIFSNKKNIDQVNILFNGENIKQVEYHRNIIDVYQKK